MRDWLLPPLTAGPRIWVPPNSEASIYSLPLQPVSPPKTSARRPNGPRCNYCSVTLLVFISEPHRNVHRPHRHRQQQQSICQSVRHTATTEPVMYPVGPRPQRHSGIAAPPVRLARPSPALGQPPARRVTVHDKARHVRSCQIYPPYAPAAYAMRGRLRGRKLWLNARAFGLRQAV